MNAWRLGALLIVIALSAVNLLRLAQAVPPPARTPGAAPDQVARQERRLAALRADLLARGLPGPVGYVGSPPAEDPHREEVYFQTQFVLAPLVLDPGSTPRAWAVANLRPAAGPAAAPEGWRIERDFGDGVLLLRQAKK